LGVSLPNVLVIFQSNGFEPNKKTQGLSMKFLNRLVKRIESVAFLFGFLVTVWFLFLPAKYFITWHALPKAPDPITKIISNNHMGDVIVQTVANKKYACHIYGEIKCWTELDANIEPLTLGNTLCLMEDCPGQHIVQIVTASNASHGISQITTQYALHDDGNIYVKQFGFIDYLGCIVAVFVGGFFAIITFAGKNILIGIISSFGGDRNKSNENDPS
jgi:hypothetical protein